MNEDRVSHPQRIPSANPQITYPEGSLMMASYFHCVGCRMTGMSRSVGTSSFLFNFDNSNGEVTRALNEFHHAEVSIAAYLASHSSLKNLISAAKAKGVR